LAAYVRGSYTDAGNDAVDSLDITRTNFTAGSKQIHPPVGS
jgi:hypothetical protein